MPPGGARVPSSRRDIRLQATMAYGDTGLCVCHQPVLFRASELKDPDGRPQLEVDTKIWRKSESLHNFASSDGLSRKQVNPLHVE